MDDIGRKEEERKKEGGTEIIANAIISSQHSHR